MKIAFTSCFSATLVPEQPVWDDIAQHNPDALVLLGDSVYIDVPTITHELSGELGKVGPSDARYPHTLFASHLLGLYTEQLRVSNFANLIQSVRSKIGGFSIWDDHDFMCNNAEGAWRNQPGQMGKMVISSNLMQCWREALSQKPIALPETATQDQPRVWKNHQENERLIDYDAAMPGYSAKDLRADVVLHLTDGRSWRAKKDMLGSAQRELMQKRIETHENKDAIHIVASGSMFNRGGRSGWLDHEADSGWLLQLASKYNIMMLSGDVHKNHISDPIPAGNKKFYEITSSGAAVNFSPLNTGKRDQFGQFTRKFGILDFKTDSIEVKLFDHGVTTPGHNMVLPLSF